jgi:ATP-binding cassette subfamily B protein
MTTAPETERAPEPWPSWRYAWRLHRFRPRRQLVNLAGVLLGWGSNLLPGIAGKIVFDRLAAGTSTASLSWLLWPFALLAMTAAATVVTAFTLQSTNGAFAFANAAMLQRNLLRRILELPGGRALPSSPGEAVSRFRDDTEHVIWWPIGFNNVIGSAVTGGIAVVVMARIHPAITVAVFLPLALVVAIVEATRGRLVAYRDANRVRTAELTGYIGDVFAAVQTVQVGNAEARVVERFRELNARRRRAAVRDRLLEEVLKGSFWVVNLGTGVVLIFAGRALQSGSFTVGDLALFVYYLHIFEEFTRDVGGGLSGYRQLAVSFRRMHQLLAGSRPERLVEDDEIFERGPLPPKTTRRPAVEPLRELRLDHLGYRHDGGGGDGIVDVSIVVPRGTFTVVTGRIGSGKTTLLQSILGLVPATGTISWNGTPVADPATFLVPPRTAYTPQVPVLFSETLEDNILLGAEGDIDEAIRLAVLREDVGEMPDGLATRIGSRGVRLSGGQVQRTAAARMFVRRPELLVCDDLSSALDVETEAALWGRVLEGGQRTVLAVSHRRAALQRADQIVVLRDGRVDDIGPLDALLDRCEEMRALWRFEVAAEAPPP